MVNPAYYRLKSYKMSPLVTDLVKIFSLVKKKKEFASSIFKASK